MVVEFVILIVIGAIIQAIAIMFFDKTDTFTIWFRNPFRPSRYFTPVGVWLSVVSYSLMWTGVIGILLGRLV